MLAFRAYKWAKLKVEYNQSNGNRIKKSSLGYIEFFIGYVLEPRIYTPTIRDEV